VNGSENGCQSARPRTDCARIGWIDAGVAGAYSLAAIGATWPLAEAPSRIGTPHYDAYGNIWAIAWVVHQMARDPLHLFDANMFFPWTKSLAYAESLLPQALQAAPILAAGGSVLLAYNLVLISTFVMSALGAYWLGTELSGSRRAGFLAGLAFGFFAYRWHHIVHLQSLSTQWLPLALVCARRAMRTPAGSWLFGLFSFTALQCLSSGYYAMLTLLAVGLTLLFEWREGRLRPLIASLSALLLGVVVLLPVFYQYREIRERHGFSRGRAEAEAWSARPRSYLDPGPHAMAPHLKALHERVEDREPLYAGSWALVFAGVGCIAAARSRTAALALSWLVVGFVISLGPSVHLLGSDWPGPFELFRLLPGGSLLRTPARLGVLAVLGLDMLACLGWAWMERSWRLGALPFVLAALLGAVESQPLALRGVFREVPRAPASVAWLAQAPRGPVLELPWMDEPTAALYLYWSTGHWQPMINGFASFQPPGSLGLGLLGNRWPSEYTARVFRASGVRYVVVHTDRMEPQRLERLRLARMPFGVSLLATLGPDRVYGIAAE